MLSDSDFVATRPDDLEHAHTLPVNLPQVLRALDEVRSRPVVTLAVAIRQLGMLSPRELDVLWRENPALLSSRSTELVRRQRLTPEDLNRALARTAGLVEVDAAGFELPANDFEVLPLRVQCAHDLLYLGEASETLFVASWYPTNEEMHGYLCGLTGRSVRMVWAEREAIAARLGQLEPAGPRPELAPLMDPTGLLSATSRTSAMASTKTLPTSLKAAFASRNKVSLADQDMPALLAEAMRELASGAETEDLAEVANASSMVRLVKRMIDDASSMGASDIHIETNPGEEFTLIRLRRDGDLELYQKLPPRLRAPLISRIKVMARLDITERRRPQDGKINFSEFGGGPLELRVAIMPTHDGMEDVVMRLLASSHPIPLAGLGLQQRDADTVARMSARSFGLILAVGPTGSGKTTTLHSMLSAINTEERKIWTAEDPIEITQPGLRQVQVNPKIGLTFASAMRGFLRSDPDVIMIGEIRDQETASIAVEAALTGHLVLSTLHTNSAAESVTRLLDLGMDALNFADSLVGIVAQRLVRALCSHCAQQMPLLPGQFDQTVLEYIEGAPLTVAEGASRLLAAAGVASPDLVRVRMAQGCEHCSGKGYKGRLGVYEILENSPAIRLLIQRHARPVDIFEEAVRNGMRSLRHDALEKWFQGKTDLRQARVAYL